MDLQPGTILLTADAMSMYKDIQTCPALNQISQYINGNKTKYLHLPVGATLRAINLIMKNKFCYSEISTGYNSKAHLWEHHPHRHRLQFSTMSLNYSFLKYLEITYFCTDYSYTMKWFY